jgi:DNA-binding transcriptional LysR family regulator
MDRLVSRSVDLLVCPFLEPRDAVVESEQLLETSIVIVARPDHPLCTTPPASLRELSRYPIATSIVDPRYLKMLRTDYGIDLEAQVGRIVCSDFDLLIRTVSRSNRLFTVGPRFAFVSDIASGQLKVVRLQVPFRHSIGLHVNRLAYPLPAVAKVIDIIRQAFVAIRAEEARLAEPVA